MQKSFTFIIPLRLRFCPGCHQFGDDISAVLRVPLLLPKKIGSCFAIFDRERYMHPTRRKDLKQLVEIYAFRTRRLSEVVAVLGEHLTAEREIDEIVAEIKIISRLVEEAGAELVAFIGQRPEESRNG